MIAINEDDNTIKIDVIVEKVMWMCENNSS